MDASPGRPVAAINNFPNRGNAAPAPLEFDDSPEYDIPGRPQPPPAVTRRPEPATISAREFSYRMMALGTVGSLAVAVVALGALLCQSFLEAPALGGRSGLHRGSQQGILRRRTGSETGSGLPSGNYFAAAGPTIYAAGIPILQERSSDGAPPESRARIVAARLNEVVRRGAAPGRIVLTTLKHRAVIAYRAPRARSTPLATVDPETAASLGYAGASRKLAAWWVDVLRDHVMILHGRRPRWTTRYARPMLQLFEAVERERVSPLTAGSVHHAAMELPQPVRASLSSLYAEVPVDYRIGGPVRRPTRAAAKATPTVGRINSSSGLPSPSLPATGRQAAVMPGAAGVAVYTERTPYYRPVYRAVPPAGSRYGSRARLVRPGLGQTTRVAVVRRLIRRVRGRRVRPRTAR